MNVTLALNLIGLIACLTGLNGCGNPLPEETSVDAVKRRTVNLGPSLPSITKTHQLLGNEGNESTPIVWNNQVLIIRFGIYDFVNWEMATAILDVKGNLISQFKWPYHYGCALVVGTRLYIFATNTAETEVSLRYTDDLQTWSTPETVLTATGDQAIYNTSVAPAPGGYVMAYEVQENGSNFTFRIANSPDLIHWTTVTPVFNSSSFATGCPTIRYSNGFYYVFYINTLDDADGNGGTKTVEVKSADLVNWVYAKHDVLTPDRGYGTSTSDLDFVEYNGKMFILYMEGDQMGPPPGYTMTSLQLYAASFDGNEAAFLEAAFQ